MKVTSLSLAKSTLLLVVKCPRFRASFTKMRRTAHDARASERPKDNGLAPFKANPLSGSQAL